MKINKAQKHYFLFLVFVLSFFVTLLVPVVATAKSFGEMTPTDQAKSWLYFNSLSKCFADDDLHDDNSAIGNVVGVGNKNRIHQKNADAGKWFSGNERPTTGYFLSGKGLSTSGDHVDCDGDSIDWISDAWELWGYKNATEALCDFGAKRDNKSDCLAGSGDFLIDGNRKDKFQDAVKAKVYGGKDPILTDAAQYALRRDALFAGCLGTTNPSPYTGSANDERTYTVTTFNADGSRNDGEKFYGEKKKSDKIKYSISPNLNNIEGKCGELASDINKDSKYTAAYQNFLRDNADNELGKEEARSATSEPPSDSTSSCAIDGIGWIVCPVVNFMAGVVDGSYGLLENTLLQVEPLGFGTNKDNPRDGLYIAWGIMRNFANIAFVIAFLIIVYSQITGVGITNYGLKKLLPKLVIAAIAVNLSYFICALAVDFSNIAGNSIKELLDGITGKVTGSNFDSNLATGENGWQSLAGKVMAGTLAGAAVAGVASFATLALFLPILITVVVSVITVVLVLTLRQALIVILIVVAPLAFVALLLPNTEEYFKRWRTLFTTMLLMYPIIALIFGGAALASKIIMASSTDFTVQVMGAGVGIIPLLITPVVMKTAGGLLNRFAGVVNNPAKGPADRLRKRAEGYKDYRSNVNKGNRFDRGAGTLEGSGGRLGGQYSRRRKAAAFFKSGGQTTAVNQEQKHQFAKKYAEEQGQEYFAKRALEDDGFAEKIAGPNEVQLKASATSAVNKIEKEEVSAREVLIKAQGDPRNLIADAGEALKAAIISGDAIGARAAQSILLSTGTKGRNNLENTLLDAENNGHFDSEEGKDVGKELRSDLNSAGLKPLNNALATWSYTSDKDAGGNPVDNRLSTIKASAKTYSGLSDKELITQSESNLRAAVASKAVTAERAKQLLESDTLGMEFNEEKRKIISSAIEPPES